MTDAGLFDPMIIWSGWRAISRGQRALCIRMHF